MKTLNFSTSRRQFLASTALATAGYFETARFRPALGVEQQSNTNSMNAQQKALNIDIPVKLPEVNIVFSIASLSFEGDLPASLFHLQLILNDISDWNAKSRVVAVFHTNAGHVTLHDQAYNTDRNIATGNPYKKLVTDLMDRRVQVELCGATAKAHGWGNAELMPGIKVNTDAMSRTTQLVQEGYVKVSES